MPSSLRLAEHAAAVANRIGDSAPSLPPNLTPLRNPISPWDSECARLASRSWTCYCCSTPTIVSHKLGVVLHCAQTAGTAPSKPNPRTASSSQPPSAAPAFASSSVQCLPLPT